MKTQNLFIILLIGIILGACSKNDEKLYCISGKVQKGPFINGSEIVIYELNEQLAPTGRTFRSTISNLGEFQLSSVNLVSPYAELVANGYYFNEVTGELSSSTVKLSAIVDLEDKQNINVNVLTNLQHKRIKYLVQNQRKSFSQAQAAANSEIMAIFSFDAAQIDDAAQLDISATGTDNAILLAISSILQGNLSTAEMSKTMSDLITDLEEDGTFDDLNLKNRLYSEATLLNTNKIAQNLKTYYSELGIDLQELNTFDEKINEYIENTDAEFVSSFTIPQSTDWGINILAITDTVFQEGKYSLAVEMPSTGTFKVKFTILEGKGRYYYTTPPTQGFTATLFNHQTLTQTFTSSNNSKIASIALTFNGYAKAKVQIFYNDVEIPSLSRNIQWGKYFDTNFNFPIGSPLSTNLLRIDDTDTIYSDSTYMISVYSQQGIPFSFNFDLSYPETVSIDVTNGFDCKSYSVEEGILKTNIANRNTRIIFKMHGKGTINLSSDFNYNDGSILNKTFILKQ